VIPHTLDLPSQGAYHTGMSKQITVRLPDNLVDFIDQRVAVGAVASRAEIVTRALEREYRDFLSARDAEILARTGPDPDLEAFMQWASQHPPKDLDLCARSISRQSTRSGLFSY
jgi:Arc/MetJ-type ribon-helix-helix transcriptional regulator